MKEVVIGNKRLDNKGFSLVEILISMAILAVIVVPLINNFMGAANVNQKAKRIQRATTVAQNIMEGLKAVNTEKTSKQFNGDPGNPFTILNSANYLYSDKYEMDNEVSRKKLDANKFGAGPPASTVYTDIADTATYKFTEKTPPKYVYAVDGIKDGIDTYDALIKVDADVFRAANDFKMPNLIDLNSATTVVLDSNGTKDLAIDTLVDRSIVYKSLYGSSTTKVFTAGDIKACTTMTMELDIKKIAVPGSPVKYRATGQITYRVNNSDYEAPDKEVTMTVYSQDFSSLENIYIMYLSFDGVYHDNITINYNNCDLPNSLDVFVVEQYVPGVPKGRIKYKIHNVGVNPDKKVKLYSNIDSSNVAADIATEITINSGNEVVLDNASATNRLYNIQVEIYSAETVAASKYSQKLATLSSAREE